MDRKYDTYVPSALPSASLGRRRGPPIGGVRQFGDEEPTDDLEKSYVQWNTRIDKEVKAVVEGLGDVVRLADVSWIDVSAYLASCCKSMIFDGEVCVEGEQENSHCDG